MNAAATPLEALGRRARFKDDVYHECLSLARALMDGVPAAQAVRLRDAVVEPVKVVLSHPPVMFDAECLAISAPDPVDHAMCRLTNVLRVHLGPGPVGEFDQETVLAEALSAAAFVEMEAAIP